MKPLPGVAIELELILLLTTDLVEILKPLERLCFLQVFEHALILGVEAAGSLDSLHHGRHRHS